MTTLGKIGELAAIRRICRFLPRRADIVQGAGDDCAVVRARRGEDWLLTSDPVIEGVHFGRRTPPAAIGHKAVGRVLSDIAAMGGEPRWCLLDLVAPPRTPVSRIEAIYRGAARLANRHGLAIVGGDTARGPVLEIHAFGAGVAPTGCAILRSGAQAGDILYVTGGLGGSRRGRHLRFEPRLAQGIWLRGKATSLIDLSDGLASDLRHLVEMSRVGARLDLRRIPVSRDARGMRDGVPPVQHALCDGEDFELLFTVPPSLARDFGRRWRRRFALRCTPIGVMTARRGVIECIDEAGRVSTLRKTGYQHFLG